MGLRGAVVVLGLAASSCAGLMPAAPGLEEVERRSAVVGERRVYAAGLVVARVEGSPERSLERARTRAAALAREAAAELLAGLDPKDRALVADGEPHASAGRTSGSSPRLLAYFVEGSGRRVLAEARVELFDRLPADEAARTSILARLAANHLARGVERPDMEAPAWLRARETFERDALAYGVGSATAIKNEHLRWSAADARARADLAKNVATAIAPIFDHGSICVRGFSGEAPEEGPDLERVIVAAAGQSAEIVEHYADGESAWARARTTAARIAERLDAGSPPGQSRAREVAAALDSVFRARALDREAP